MDQQEIEIVNQLNESRKQFIQTNKVSERKKIVKTYAQKFQEFVENGNDLNFISNHQKFIKGTPVWLASLIFIEGALDTINSIEKRFKELEYIFNLLSNFDLDKSIVRGKSVTGWASYCDAWATAIWMCEDDPNINSAPTPVFDDIVVKGSNTKKIQLGILLLEKLESLGFDIDKISTRTGATALMRAAAYTSIEQIEWLLEHGADVNAVDYHGATALSHALSPDLGIDDFTTRRRVGDTVRLLLSKSARIDTVPVTSQNFSNLLTKCKSLKKEDKNYFKEVWKTHYEKDKSIKTRRISKGEFTLENKISDKDILALFTRTDFLLFPYMELMYTLLEFLEDKGITQFTLTDIVTLLDSNWNGIELREVKRDFSLAHIEWLLGKIVIGRIRLVNAKERYLNVIRDMETGSYSIESICEENVVKSYVPV